MAAFKSPAVWLGLSAGPAPLVQGGFRTPLPLFPGGSTGGPEPEPDAKEWIIRARRRGRR